MIKVVDTPNPDTKKFVFDYVIVGEGSKEFKKKDGSLGFVDNLFDIGNIELIFLDKNFISVRKSKNASWENLAQKVLEILSENINKDFSPLIFKEENEFTDEVSIRIETGKSTCRCEGDGACGPSSGNEVPTFDQEAIVTLGE